MSHSFLFIRKVRCFAKFFWSVLKLTGKKWGEEGHQIDCRLITESGLLFFGTKVRERAKVFLTIFRNQQISSSFEGELCFNASGFYI
jgi:hypothetical protein